MINRSYNASWRYIFTIVALLCLWSLPVFGEEITVGAARTSVYAPLLKGKRVALLSNHTGLVGARHTLDVMLDEGINVVTLFSPEHGFRGTADAGEHVKNGVDEVTGIPIASMYTGTSKGIAPEVMKGLDVIVVDLQDVGTRFYTYYITMIKVMEEAAAAGKKVVVLDRPNPLGMVVDGPVLDMSLRSGVGRLPVPVLHGMTLGELAMMANGEGWLREGRKVDLTVVECEGYTHASRYKLPVAPSPNLRDMTAIYLYPSLCFFEGTVASVGRGTDFPFKVYGHPDMQNRGFTFMPRSVPGAKNPPLLNRRCNGVDLTRSDSDSLIARGVDLTYVIDAYQSMPATRRSKFFSAFFDKLIGNRKVRLMIIDGLSADEIKKSWTDEVEEFKTLRSQYLLYPES
ncbi:MAG: DUF1343 domain-containing protein [Muribaculum sp.]|nr:DUF1343 domain-containing protein [Muribaculum sp.]MDE6457343.1 DUF1343 domain-containing protein [Muribaculum sp.]